MAVEVEVNYKDALWSVVVEVELPYILQAM